MAAQNYRAPAVRTLPAWPLRLIAVLAAVIWLRFFVFTVHSMKGLPPPYQRRAQAAVSQPTTNATVYKLFPFFATPTITASPTVTLTPTLTLTPTPSETATPLPSLTPSITPTATLGAGAARENATDGQWMQFIPAGTFRMGDNHEGRKRHVVTLDAFWMGRTQVTNAQYRRCVEEGGCTKPIRKEINPHYFDPEYDNHPAVYVVWGQAATYCTWAGGRLPTEAEWERAASGNGKREYAWGNTGPNSKRANINHRNGTTKPVGSYPKGASPYGVLDMGGNVREWVNDFYSGSYYNRSPEYNPQGPEKGKKHVLRGAAWHDPAEYGTVFKRYAHVPDSAGWNRGFRCAFDNQW